MATKETPEKGNGDVVASAINSSASPRMTPHEISFMMAACARIPALYMLAKERISTDLFDRSEARYVLLWRSIAAACDSNRGKLPTDLNAAKEIVAVKCAAEMATDPAKLFYTPRVEADVLDQAGLLDCIYALPVVPETEEEGRNLLAKFITERSIADPLRRALAGLSSQESMADPAALIEAIGKHTRSIAGLSASAMSDAVREEEDEDMPGPKMVTTCLGWMDRMLDGGAALQEAYSLISMTSNGKCLARGTKVLMYDGSTKNVEDIEVGEKLMGPDSKPRNVLSLARGREEMCRIRGIDGTHYDVNVSHILSLKLSPIKKGNSHTLENISVSDYLNKSKGYKHRAKCYRVGIDLPHQSVPLTPYFLGLWLADGTATKPHVTKPDLEVRQAVESEAARFGLHVINRAAKEFAETNPTWGITHGLRGEANPITQILRQLNLLSNKHIPDIYLKNDRQTRLDLLAGLLDGDGNPRSVASGGVGYEYTTISEQLAEGIVWLVRSLGFYASCTKRTTTCQTGAECESYRIGIAGNCYQIPCRIPRKKMNKLRSGKRDPLIYGFKVTSLGEGDYYGFEIDGDRLFLLGDFTVTHNTALSVQLALEGANLQASLVPEIGSDEAGHWYYFTYELNENQLRERVYCYGAKIHHHTFRDKDLVTRKINLSTAEIPSTLKEYEYDSFVNSPGNPMRGERERLRELKKRQSGVNSRLHLVDFSGTHPGNGIGGVDEIRYYLENERAKGRRISGIVIDYAGLAITRYVAAKNWDPSREYNLLASYIDHVRSKISVPFDCVAWIPHQVHGDAATKPPGVVPHHSEARGCRNFADNADFAIQWSAYHKTTGLVAFKTTKHRRAPGMEDPIIVRFDGRFGAFVDPEQEYVVDPMTKQIVPKNYMDVLPIAGSRGTLLIDPRANL